MLKGNKGEWSELYTLFKLLADGHLYRGNYQLEKIENSLLPIIKVLRQATDGTYSFDIQQKIVLITKDSQIVKIPVDKFKEHAEKLLAAIHSSTDTTFAAPEIEQFIRLFNCSSLKASSHVKSDINVVLHDAVTNRTPELGFSIKSQLGSPSTLLNAGKTTNFIYRLDGQVLNTNMIEEINAINSQKKIQDRLLKLMHYAVFPVFHSTESTTFLNNLMLVDSLLPNILGYIIHAYYSTPTSALKELVNQVAAENPLNYDASQSHPFYTYKIKRFLTDIALGMMPATVWTGHLEATGGYLVVKEDGELLAYHVYNRNDFENYLLNNTKLETASSSKHDFGYIYEQDNEQYIKLNLQIRFKK